MKLNPYLSFDGDCRAAFESYARTLGGRITFIQAFGESPMASTVPADAHDRIMHVTLEAEGQTLQGADALPGQYTRLAGFSLALSFDDLAEGERVFTGLAEHGQVQLPFQPTFWAKGFGMLIDRFGTPWIVSAGEVEMGGDTK